MFLKIEDNGTVCEPPREFIENGERICGFTEEFMNKHGYYLLVESNPPDEDNYEVSYSLEDNKIIMNWKLK